MAFGKKIVNDSRSRNLGSLRQVTCSLLFLAVLVVQSCCQLNVASKWNNKTRPTKRQMMTDCPHCLQLKCIQIPSVLYTSIKLDVYRRTNIDINGDRYSGLLLYLVTH